MTYMCVVGAFTMDGSFEHRYKIMLISAQCTHTAAFRVKWLLFSHCWLLCVFFFLLQQNRTFSPHFVLVCISFSLWFIFLFLLILLLYSLFFETNGKSSFEFMHTVDSIDSVETVQSVQTCAKPYSDDGRVVAVY